MGSLPGAIPSRATTPFTSPAVAVSIFWLPGAVAGVLDVLDVSLVPPPHAIPETVSTRHTAPTRTFRKRIDLSWTKNDDTNTTSYSTLLRAACGPRDPISNADPTTRPGSPSGRPPAS